MVAPQERQGSGDKPSVSLSAPFTAAPGETFGVAVRAVGRRYGRDISLQDSSDGDAFVTVLTGTLSKGRTDKRGRLVRTAVLRLSLPQGAHELRIVLAPQGRLVGAVSSTRFVDVVAPSLEVPADYRRQGPAFFFHDIGGGFHAWVPGSPTRRIDEHRLLPGYDVEDVAWGLGGPLSRPRAVGNVAVRVPASGLQPESWSRLLVIADPRSGELDHVVVVDEGMSEEDATIPFLTFYSPVVADGASSVAVQHYEDGEPVVYGYDVETDTRTWSEPGYLMARPDEDTSSRTALVAPIERTCPLRGIDMATGARVFELGGSGRCDMDYGRDWVALTTSSATSTVDSETGRALAVAPRDGYRTFLYDRAAQLAVQDVGYQAPLEVVDVNTGQVVWSMDYATKSALSVDVLAFDRERLYLQTTDEQVTVLVRTGQTIVEPKPEIALASIAGGWTYYDSGFVRRDRAED